LDQQEINMTTVEAEKIKLAEIRKGNLAILDHKLKSSLPLTMQMIHHATKQVLGYAPDQSRTNKSAFFRFYVFYFARMYTNISLYNIAAFYRMNRVMPLHGLRVIEQGLNNLTMPEVAGNVDKITKVLKIT
jgi:hypothetical protein